VFLPLEWWFRRCVRAEQPPLKNDYESANESLRGGSFTRRETRLAFRILGPLETEKDGRLLTLGGPKQRALLALLLLHANEALDLGRFERFMREGRAALAAGDARQASEKCSAALALWRGTPLADFGEQFGGGEAAAAGQREQPWRGLGAHRCEGLCRARRSSESVSGNARRGPVRRAPAPRRAGR
jgi:hypothetical protein